MFTPGLDSSAVQHVGELRAGERGSAHRPSGPLGTTNTGPVKGAPVPRTFERVCNRRLWEFFKICKCQLEGIDFAAHPQPPLREVHPGLGEMVAHVEQLDRREPGVEQTHRYFQVQVSARAQDHFLFSPDGYALRSSSAELCTRLLHRLASQSMRRAKAAAAGKPIVAAHNTRVDHAAVNPTVGRTGRRGTSAPWE